MPLTEYDLPREAEYEYVARCWLKGRGLASGDELAPSGQKMVNLWPGLLTGQSRN